MKIAKIITISTIIFTSLILSACTGNEIQLNDADKQINQEFLKSKLSMSNLALFNLWLSKIPEFTKYMTGTLADEVLYVDLANNEIETLDWKEFANFRNLREINIPFNKIDNFKNIDTIKNIITIDLTKNQLVKLDWMEKMQYLQNANLSFNQIDSVSKLGSLNNLKVLSLAHNKLNNADALANLEKLEELHLEFNNISNVESLSAKTDQIKILTVWRNPLDEDVIKTLNEMSYENQKK